MATKNDNTIVAFTVRIPKQTKNKLELLASGYGMTLSDYVTDVFERHIASLPDELRSEMARLERVWQQVKEQESQDERKRRAI